MLYLRSMLPLATLALLAGSPALAQDNAAETYPDVCKAEAAHAGHGAPAAQPEPDMSAMNEHQQASMQGMMKMDRDMMQGMMKEDADVAFICGMIAHHQGAIDMSMVELEHGDDPWAKEMAQKVIDAQTREIADMTKWLEENAE